MCLVDCDSARASTVAHNVARVRLASDSYVPANLAARGAGIPASQWTMTAVNFSTGLVLLTALLLSGVSHAAGMPDGDTGKWKTYRVEVGMHVVQFTIPPGESRDFMPFEIPSRIDTAREGVFDQALKGPSVLDLAWDYRKSRFSVVDGSLTAYIGLRRSEKPLSDMAALREAVTEASRLSAIQNYLRSGSVGRSDNPGGFSPAQVAGAQRMAGFLRNVQNSLFVALDSAHFLRITIRYGGVTNPKSKADA